MPTIARKVNFKRSQLVQHGKQILVGLALLLGITIIVVATFNSGEKGGRVLLSGTEAKKAPRLL